MSGFRENKEMTWWLITQKRESAYQPEKELKNWGLTVRDFTLLSSLKPEDQAQKEYKYTALLKAAHPTVPSQDC